MWRCGRPCASTRRRAMAQATATAPTAAPRRSARCGRAGAEASRRRSGCGSRCAGARGCGTPPPSGPAPSARRPRARRRSAARRARRARGGRRMAMQVSRLLVAPACTTTASIARSVRSCRTLSWPSRRGRPRSGPWCRSSRARPPARGSWRQCASAAPSSWCAWRSCGRTRRRQGEEPGVRRMRRCCRRPSCCRCSTGRLRRACSWP
mmetsp:Transcript_177120/g.568033  ORF Transcript_177120/g.568033 Transcript_177120/m.568033 type:complete len:208 (-) Transcript_177120:2724-3347(-)